MLIRSVLLNLSSYSPIFWKWWTKVNILHTLIHLQLGTNIAKYWPMYPPFQVPPAHTWTVTITNILSLEVSEVDIWYHYQTFFLERIFIIQSLLTYRCFQLLSTPLCHNNYHNAFQLYSKWKLYYWSSPSSCFNFLSSSIPTHTHALSYPFS